MLNKQRVIALATLSLDLHPEAQVDALPSSCSDNEWVVDVNTPSEDGDRLYDISYYRCKINPYTKEVIFGDSFRNISRFTIC